MAQNTVLIVPTIRENNFVDFVNRWKSIGLFDHIDLMVMEDNPEKTFHVPDIQNAKKNNVTYHCSWKSIERDLKDDQWIIPRRSDTVRSYAYWKAWKLGYENILTLDDDCYPTRTEDGLKYDGAAFISEHMKQLNYGVRWFNTLNSVKPRGIPFYNLGDRQNVIVNHGLWTKTLDYDAPFQLANPIPEEFSFDSRTVPRGQYFPMCGMNVMWKAPATVLMYHLLMGQTIIKNDKPLAPGDGWYKDVNGDPKTEKLPFDRFGDIWCGIFMKKIADDLDCSVRTGMPYIRHERASNPFTNLRKEANGIEVNENLWEYVDSLVFRDVTAGVQLHPNERFIERYIQLGVWISQYDKYKEHVPYFKKLGEAMQVWARLFSNRDITTAGDY